MRRTERAGRHASDRQIQLAALLLTTVISLTFLIYHPRHPEFGELCLAASSESRVVHIRHGELVEYLVDRF